MKNITTFFPLVVYCLVSWKGFAFAPSSPCKISPLARLYASGPPPDDPDTPESTVDNENATEQTPSLLSNDSTPKIPVVFQLQTVVWYTFAGVALLGVVFNLFGYAFTFEDGSFRFDTLREIRMERLLDEESSASSSGSAGLSEFFFKNPFTSTLLLTGIVLVYENVVYGGRKKQK